MATKILFEIWDFEMKKQESATSFDTVESFLAEAKKFKARKDTARLRVHIPGGLKLSSADTVKIDELGITLF